MSIKLEYSPKALSFASIEPDKEFTIVTRVNGLLCLRIISDGHHVSLYYFALAVYYFIGFISLFPHIHEEEDIV